MKIKSLLIGSAALMTASTGAYAADAIVMAEPEPVEYVRVCDVYGAGFFYIPGTETCLKIGGYVRFEVRATAGFAGYWTRSRFTPTFDARSETEWGTLRGYAEVEMNYDSLNVVNAAGVLAPTGNYFNLAHAFIEVIGGSGTLRIGRTHSPYSRFLGYGGPGTNDGAYGFNNTQEISYTFAGSNGFSAIVALVENSRVNGGVGFANSWATNVEAGVNFAQGWGSIGAIAGYDGFNNQWGAKAVARFNGGNGFSAGLHVFYASGGAGTFNTYRVSANQLNWSALGHVNFAFSPKAAVFASAQWFDNSVWAFVGGVAFTPAPGLLIRPEVTYTTAGAAGGAGVWGGLVRVQRSF